MKHKLYVEEALLEIGAEKLSDTNYKYKNIRIKIYKDTQLSDIFVQLVNAGAQLQIWQIQTDLSTPINATK